MLTADALWTLAVAGIFTPFSLCGMVAVAAILRPAAREVERQDQLALADQAADFGEPTRTEVEADEYWGLFRAPEFMDTPIYAAMRHEEDVWFAASVMADIDDLPGGAA